jgi:predicted ribosomally synthesized peptide with nif11-like leader
MSASKAQELIQKMTTDVEFRKQVETATSSEAKKAILAAHGFSGITAENIREAAAAQGTELTDAELEAVAGGRVVEWVGATAACVGAAAAAAA